MKHRVTLWLLGWLLTFPVTFSVFGQSQAISRFDRRMTPPSPEATQLGVFGSNPPDLHTGAVQTNVPLLTVKSRQLSLAVALNYHYTGLQVTEVPSWVGLGWTLSAGGVITRTVQGLPDELGAGKGYCMGAWSTLRNYGLRNNTRNGSITIPLIGPGSNQPKATFLQHVTEGWYDSEPDAYNVSTPFYSGKLFLDSAGVITCSPHTDVKFVGNPGIGDWTATTGDGTTYRYSPAERTRPIIVDEAAGGITATTAWYLAEIVSADGTDRIRLEYGYRESPNAVPTAYTVTRQTYSPVPLSYTVCSPQLRQHIVMPDVMNDTWGGAKNYVRSAWLTAITTSTTNNNPLTRVEFLSDLQRSDVDTSVAGKDRPARRLTRIQQWDEVTHQLKTQYNLSYGYFSGGSAKEKRLRLESVQEVGKPAYVFSYDATQALPLRESFARDHWGYYNGKTNQTLMPRLPPALQTYMPASGGSGATGADRSADGRYAKLGALMRIQYPTGGWTQFAYEPNEMRVPCNYAAIAADQFGGVPSVPATTFYAAATGGQTFHDNMTDLDWEYAGTNSPPSDQSFPGGGAPLRNVKVTQLNALTGFQVVDARCLGRANSTQTPPSGSTCPGMVGPITTYLYQVHGDSTTAITLTRLCKVSYEVDEVVQNGTRTCKTTIYTASSDALRLQHFPAGRYYLVAEVISNDAALNANISLDVIFDPKPDGSPCSMSLEVGGIRLASTRDFAGIGDTLVKTYRYRRPLSEGGTSSAVLFFKPEYAYARSCNQLVVSAMDVGKTNWLSSGYHVGYGRVEVESQGRQAGTTVYSYLNSDEYGSNCRSLLLKQEDWSQDGTVVRRTTSTYAYERIASSPGFQLSKEYDVIGECGGGSCVVETNFWLTTRSYSSYWPKLVSTTEQVFGTGTAGAGSTGTTTGYTYLARGPQATTQPIRVAKQGANGQWQITHTRYPGQYGVVTNAAGTASTTGLSGAPALGLAKLVERHLISVPVEHQQWIRTGTDSAVIGGDVAHFANLRPARIFALTPVAPVPAQQFVASRLQGSFQQDSRYLERVTFPLYSPAGSLLQQRVAQAPPSSYLWGYAETKLLAEVTNAPYSQIAYTSFEPDARGRWQYNDTTSSRIVGVHVTGQRGFELDPTPAGSVRRAGLSAGEYELLVWGHGANAPVLTGATVGRYERVATAGDWQQHRYRLTVAANATVQLNAPAGFLLWIDELRLHPVGAQMSSYTYDPLVGMTSQTDPAGRTTTYEYDAVGRLVRARDEQGRIRTQQDYRYARP